MFHRINREVRCIKVTKVTKRNQFVAVQEILTGLGETDRADFIGAQIALIDKRKTADRKPTKAQEANAEIKESIVETLIGFDGLTATEVAGTEDISVQKASQLLTQLVAAEIVIRVEGKGKEKTKFSLANRAEVDAAE